MACPQVTQEACGQLKGYNRPFKSLAFPQPVGCSTTASPSLPTLPRIWVRVHVTCCCLTGRLHHQAGAVPGQPPAAHGGGGHRGGLPAGELSRGLGEGSICLEEL